MKTKPNRPGVQGVNLARLRHAAGLSQRKLAKSSGVHEVQIANLERGETQEARRDTLERPRPSVEQSASDTVS